MTHDDPSRRVGALAQCHAEAGARFIPGAGFEVPYNPPDDADRAMRHYRSHRPIQP